jgi:hypothetical protein
MNKETKTTQIVICCETGDINVRKATIYTDEDQEVARNESNNRYCPWLEGRKDALLAALADKPDELYYFDKLWSAEYMATKKAEHDAMIGENDA